MDEKPGGDEASVAPLSSTPRGQDAAPLPPTDHWSLPSSVDPDQFQLLEMFPYVHIMYRKSQNLALRGSMRNFYQSVSNKKRYSGIRSLKGHFRF